MPDQEAVAGTSGGGVLLPAALREAAHPPPALPEGHLGPTPGVGFLALHHSCHPHSQGPLPSRAGGFDPSQPPPSYPRGWDLLLKASLSRH